MEKIEKDIIEIAHDVPVSDSAVFLDRDGVVNEEVHLLHKIEDLKLIPGSASAIAKLNKVKIPVFIISNQTVLARGLISKQNFIKIHQKLLKLLSKSNARLDGIIYCLHSEKADLKEYRKNCPFRKPSPGMIFEIEKRLNKTFSQIFVVGDQARDIIMGNRAKAISILVKTGHAGKDFLYKAIPDIETKSLKETVEIIINTIKNDGVSAVILAGGKGTRLHSLTRNNQKVMLKVGDKPLLAWQIQNLAKNGITKINITLCHKSDTVLNYLKDRYPGFLIKTHVESSPKGTAGSILDIKSKLSENFFVIYGDVLNNVNLSKVLNFHIQNNSLCTLVVRKSDHPKDSDLIKFSTRKINEIFFKPHDQKDGYGNTGIVILNKKLIENLPKSEITDLMKNIIPIAIKQKRAFAYKILNREYVKDIGTIDRLRNANEDFMKGKIKL